MNTTDKLLQELLTPLERNEQYQKNIDRFSSEINENKTLLKQLNKSVNYLNWDFILIEKKGKHKINDFYICRHLVTQKEFLDVVGINPSFFQTENVTLSMAKRKMLKDFNTTNNNPVEMVSWYDTLYYCNKRSLLEGYNPVYSINGEVNPDKWGYTPCKGETLEKIWLNEKMTGFRLPTYNEWEHAALCGEHYIFEKAECAEDFIWYRNNSKNITHPVMQKNPNKFGLYDMIGNVWEWCWDSEGEDYHYTRGGFYDYVGLNRDLKYRRKNHAKYRSNNVGFRIVCSANLH